MINTRFNSDTGKSTLILEGKLTIENLNELKQSFLTALQDSCDLIIDHNNAEEFDFTYLQLLISLLKTAMQQNKKISFSCENPADFIQVVKTSGFHNDEQFSKIILCKN